MKAQKLKWWTKLLIVLLSLMIVFSVFPYLIPVTEAGSELTAPFPESVITDIDGVALHYRVWEPDAQPAKAKILLVHGLGGSTFSWRNNIESLLDQGYIVLAADLPGFGYSSRKRGFDHSQENRADLLWKLLDEFDNTLVTDIGNKPWDLVGHSMGGGSVTAMALSKPARTRSLVLVDGALLTGGDPSGMILRYPPAGRWIEVFARHLFFRKDRITDFLETAYGRPTSDTEAKGYYEPMQLAGTEGCLVDMVRTVSLIDENSLRELSVPVYAIWGEDDAWVPLEEARKLEAMIPALTLEIIPDAGHCPMETHSELFNGFLLESLLRNSLGSRPVFFLNCREKKKTSEYPHSAAISVTDLSEYSNSPFAFFKRTSI